MNICMNICMNQNGFVVNFLHRKCNASFFTITKGNQLVASFYRRWSSKTYQHMLKLWKSVEAGDVGASLIPYYKLINNPGGANREQPEWTKIPVAYQVINGHQAQQLSFVNDSRFT
jgi:hypothetical protein